MIDFEDENVLIRTSLPSFGHANISLRNSQNVYFRLPSRVRPEDLSIRYRGAPRERHLAFGGRYVDLGRLPAGTHIQVTFPIPEYEVRETIGGNNRGGNLRESGYCHPEERITYSIRWRGNYVRSISPRGVAWPVFA